MLGDRLTGDWARVCAATKTPTTMTTTASGPGRILRTGNWIKHLIANSFWMHGSTGVVCRFSQAWGESQAFAKRGDKRRALKKKVAAERSSVRMCREPRNGDKRLWRQAY